MTTGARQWQKKEEAKQYAEAFGRRVRELRIKQGWSGREMARLLGVSQAYVSAIELGRVSQVNRELIRDLAEALEVGPEELLYAAGYLDRPRLIQPEELALARAIAGLPESVRQLIIRMAAEYKQAG